MTRAQRVRSYAPTRAALARHEAGHALAAVAFEIPVRAVRIDVNAWADGRYCRGVTVHLKPVNPRVGATVKFAGPLAEGSFLGAAGDLLAIAESNRAWIGDCSPGSPRAIARALLATYRTDLDRLAAALLVAGELGPADLQNIVHDVLGVLGRAKLVGVED